MKIPKTFVPEKDLEEKISDLSKNYCIRKNNLDPKNLSMEELEERTKPIFECVLKTIYGKRRYHSIDLEGVPDNYQGWIDFIITNNYESKTYYCTLFDLKSKHGEAWKEEFDNSYKGECTYDFKPGNEFSVKGKVIKEGLTNDFWWYLLRIDEVYNKT